MPCVAATTFFYFKKGHFSALNHFLYLLAFLFLLLNSYKIKFAFFSPFCPSCSVYKEKCVCVCVARQLILIVSSLKGLFPEIARSSSSFPRSPTTLTFSTSESRSLSVWEARLELFRRWGWGPDLRCQGRAAILDLRTLA